jgi:hypothetical protein
VYFSIPVSNGIPDIDFLYLSEIVYLSDTQAYVALRDDFTVRDTWAEITEDEFNAKKSVFESINPVTNEDLQKQISSIGAGLVQLLLK